jgi:protein-disulfide isomerase
MKKIIIWSIVGIVLVLLGLFGWRVWYYYRLAKSGNKAVIGQSVFKDKEANKSLLTLYSPHLGNPDGKISIVEFGDFTCTYSASAFPAIRELLAKYPDKIDYVFRFFPLNQLDEANELPALAASCANEQNKFWSYHDKLFQSQNHLTAEDLKNYAQQVGLDTVRFEQCISTRRFLSQIEMDYQAGLSAGVEGTPTFFVNGAKIPGAVPTVEEWEQIIKAIK